MKTSLVLASVGAVAAVGVVGYAAYFDYRRRNDPEFRKDLSMLQLDVCSGVSLLCNLQLM